jgi:hypothetical protein
VEPPKPVVAATAVLDKRPTVTETAMAKPNMKRKKRATAAVKNFDDEEDNAPVTSVPAMTSAYVPAPAKPAPV